MPARSYQAVTALHGKSWPKYKPLGYRAGRYSIIDMTDLDRSDNMIISLYSDLFTIVHELMKRISFVLQ